MIASDKSYDALFNPGAAEDHFSLSTSIEFQPESGGFLIDNALCLAELCRFTYRLDDELRESNRISDQSYQMLAAENLQIASVMSDAATSSRAVLYSKKRDRPSQLPDSLLIFCGSNEILDWKMNAQALQDPWPGGGQVHSGFGKCYASLVGQLATLKNHGNTLWLAGHSLGGALAILALADFRSKGVAMEACYSFGCPRIGDGKFAAKLVDCSLYRVVNNCDVVTAVPRSLGVVEYRHPDRAFFIDGDGVLEKTVDDVRIQRRQLRYFPDLKKYLEPGVLLERVKKMPDSLPRYLSDHAIKNYSAGLLAQLETKTVRCS